MKKSLIILVIVVILIGIFVFRSGDAEYVDVVDDGIVELEAELADLEARIADEDLTGEAAVEIYESINARLVSINTAITTTQEDSSLTQSQKEQLVASLERFRQALVDYSDTLIALEEVVSVEDLSSENDTETASRRGQMYPGSIRSRFVASVEVVEDHIVDVITDEELADLVDEETFAEITADDASSTSTVSTTTESAATSSDSNELGTTTEETGTTTDNM